MDFRIVDTFTDSIVHLTGDAHYIAMTTASDVHLNPPDRGMFFEFFRLAGVPLYG
jgi:hypothetical protein